MRNHHWGKLSFPPCARPTSVHQSVTIVAASAVEIPQDIFIIAAAATLQRLAKTTEVAVVIVMEK